MKQVYEIDSNGYYTRPLIVEIIPENCIEQQPTQGLYKAKWNGTEWIEGATEEEINSIKNQPQEPSEIDKLKQENIEMKLAIAEMYEVMLGGSV